MALLVRFHSPMHKTAHSYQSKRFHSHFSRNVKEKGEGITTKIYFFFLKKSLAESQMALNLLKIPFSASFYTAL